MSCHDGIALESLRRSWGELYDITHPAPDVWMAERRDDGGTLVDVLPGELDGKIRADYRALPVDLPLNRHGGGGAR